MMARKCGSCAREQLRHFRVKRASSEAVWETSLSLCRVSTARRVKELSTQLSMERGDFCRGAKLLASSAGKVANEFRCPKALSAGR